MVGSVFPFLFFNEGFGTLDFFNLKNQITSLLKKILFCIVFHFINLFFKQVNQNYTNGSSSSYRIVGNLVSLSMVSNLGFNKIHQ